MKTRPSYYTVVQFTIFLILSQYLFAQKIEIPLTERAQTEEIGYHVMPFMQTPARNLKLPDLDHSKAMYFNLLYNWFPDSTNWNLNTYVMVIPEKDGERLYIDYNADDDLTNDGKPLFFSFEDNEINIDLSAPDNKDQFVRYSFCRKPKSKDSAVAEGTDGFFDKEGNLTQFVTAVFGANHEGFIGTKGTFYFDEPINVAKGKISINDKNYIIGLNDFNQNGLFNNNRDLILVDINNDGKLESSYEAFRLNEVFEIGDKKFKIEHIDPYGKNITLVETSDEATFSYLKAKQSQVLKGAITGKLDTSFWSCDYETINEINIKMSNFKGKYLLLNFWGEWCKPCLAEIPELVEGFKKFPREKLELISFLKASSFEKAREVIKEKGVLWPQIKTTDKIDDKFKVKSWPTNILIYPDGVNYLHIGPINRTFFNEFIK